MICRTLREWDYLTVSEGRAEDTIPRWAADNLVDTARASQIGAPMKTHPGQREPEAQSATGCRRAHRPDGVTLEILPKIDGLDAGATRNRLVHLLARVFDLDIANGEIADLELAEP